MSDSTDNWRDLTVNDAVAVSNFYQQVLGWTKDEVPMDGYSDYIMKDAHGNVMGGICHRKGTNQSVPVGWIPYFTTDDFLRSYEVAMAAGGQALTDVRRHGTASFVYIKDPSGANFALYSDNQ